METASPAGAAGGRGVPRPKSVRRVISEPHDPVPGEGSSTTIGRRHTLPTPPSPPTLSTPSRLPKVSLKGRIVLHDYTRDGDDGAGDDAGYTVTDEDEPGRPAAALDFRRANSCDETSDRRRITAWLGSSPSLDPPAPVDESHLAGTASDQLVDRRRVHRTLAINVNVQPGPQPSRPTAAPRPGGAGLGSSFQASGPAPPEEARQRRRSLATVLQEPPSPKLDAGAPGPAPAPEARFEGRERDELPVPDYRRRNSEVLAAAPQSHSSIGSATPPSLPQPTPPSSLGALGPARGSATASSSSSSSNPRPPPQPAITAAAAASALGRRPSSDTISALQLQVPSPAVQPLLPRPAAPPAPSPSPSPALGLGPAVTRVAGSPALARRRGSLDASVPFALERRSPSHSPVGPSPLGSPRLAIQTLTPLPGSPPLPALAHPEPSDSPPLRGSPLPPLAASPCRPPAAPCPFRAPVITSPSTTRPPSPPGPAPEEEEHASPSRLATRHRLSVQEARGDGPSSPRDRDSPPRSPSKQVHFDSSKNTGSRSLASASAASASLSSSSAGPAGLSGAGLVVPKPDLQSSPYSDHISLPESAFATLKMLRPLLQATAALRSRGGSGAAEGDDEDEARRRRRERRRASLAAEGAAPEAKRRQAPSLRRRRRPRRRTRRPGGARGGRRREGGGKGPARAPARRRSFGDIEGELAARRERLAGSGWDSGLESDGSSYPSSAASSAASSRASSVEPGRPRPPPPRAPAPSSDPAAVAAAALEAPPPPTCSSSLPSPPAPPAAARPRPRRRSRSLLLGLLPPRAPSAAPSPSPSPAPSPAPAANPSDVLGRLLRAAHSSGTKTVIDIAAAGAGPSAGAPFVPRLSLDSGGGGGASAATDAMGFLNLSSSLSAIAGLAEAASRVTSGAYVPDRDERPPAPLVPSIQAEGPPGGDGEGGYEYSTEPSHRHADDKASRGARRARPRESPTDSARAPQGLLAVPRIPLMEPRPAASRARRKSTGGEPGAGSAARTRGHRRASVLGLVGTGPGVPGLIVTPPTPAGR
eukprot:tig00021281_g19929.t1